MEPDCIFLFATNTKYCFSKFQHLFLENMFHDLPENKSWIFSPFRGIFSQIIFVPADLDFPIVITSMMFSVSFFFTKNRGDANRTERGLHCRNSIFD